MAVDISDVRTALFERLCTLATEVGDCPQEATYEEVDATLRGWGKIPDKTLDEIREMHRNLDVIARVGGASSSHAAEAAIPAQQVIDALDRLIAKVQLRKAEADAA